MSWARRWSAARPMVARSSPPSSRTRSRRWFKPTVFAIRLVRRVSMKLDLWSAAFAKDDPIPIQFTGRGNNPPPPLAWSDPPAGTKSFALTCVDPDAPRGTFIHWVAFNIPVRELKEGVLPEPVLEDGTVQGVNDFGDVGYGGPDPPPGKPHRYFFKVFALDTKLNLPPKSSHADLVAAMKGHV